MERMRTRRSAEAEKENARVVVKAVRKRGLAMAGPSAGLAAVKETKAKGLSAQPVNDALPKAKKARKSADEKPPAPVAAPPPKTPLKSAESEEIPHDFVTDIKQYLYSIEENYQIDELFLEGHTIKAKYRTIMVDWIVQVHQRFYLLAETLHLTVYLLDKMLQEVRTIEKTELQLVGMAALLAACKYEETYSPDMKDFEFIADNAYTKKQIRKMEIRVYQAAGFDLGRVHSIHFLRAYSMKVDADKAVHCLAKYFAEICLLDGNYSSYRPSMIAAGAFWLAVQVREPTLSLAKAFTDMPAEQPLEVAKTMGYRVALCVTRIRLLGTKIMAISEKYAKQNLMGVSALSDADHAVIEKLMRNAPR